MARYGREMVEQLLADARLPARFRAAIPPSGTACPTKTPVPLFVQADFGLDAEPEPKLVEIQGFPSLYAYQPLMAECYREAYGIDAALAALPGGLPLDEYHALLRRAIVGEHDPANVMLLEIDPAHQKTRCDFLRHRAPVRRPRRGYRALPQRGQSPLVRSRRPPDSGGAHLQSRHRRRTGAARHRCRPSISATSLEVEWAGHPNWFFRLSKFSLPYLRHPAVPRAQFLDRVARSSEPERYVLKPLYSFAGAGRDRGADRGTTSPPSRAAATESIHAAGARGFRPGGRDAASARPRSRCASCTSGWTKCAR